LPLNKLEYYIREYFPAAPLYIIILVHFTPIIFVTVLPIIGIPEQGYNLKMLIIIKKLFSRPRRRIEPTTFGLYYFTCSITKCPDFIKNKKPDIFIRLS